MKKKLSSGRAWQRTKRRVAEFLTFLADIPGREKSRSGCQVMSAISLSTVLIYNYQMRTGFSLVQAGYDVNNSR
jgi:hypothetical protein